MDELLLRVYERWCARSVLHLWDAPPTAQAWVDTGAEELREAAKEAAGRAVVQAEEAGMRSAEGAAVWAPWAAMYAAWAVVWSARPTLDVAKAEGDAAWAAEETARAAAGAAQSRTRDLLATLPDLLREHGLAARHLGDVREDPWLTREVVRALDLPDLAAWSDWCARMMTPGAAPDPDSPG